MRERTGKNCTSVEIRVERSHGPERDMSCSLKLFVDKTKVKVIEEEEDTVVSERMIIK